jgi:hypothetical protein
VSRTWFGSPMVLRSDEYAWRICPSQWPEGLLFTIDRSSLNLAQLVFILSGPSSFDWTQV